MPPDADHRAALARTPEAHGPVRPSANPDLNADSDADPDSGTETDATTCGDGGTREAESSDETGGLESPASFVGLVVDESANGSPAYGSPAYAHSVYPDVPTRYRSEQPFDMATVNSSSRSIYDDDFDYVVENNRRYCGNFHMPNDDLEQDRLRIIHQVYLNIFDLQLTSVHLENPRLILDIGTGTGEWAIGMAEQFTDCEVIGTDISPIQDSAVPQNVFFEVDDAEEEWTRAPNSVDLIHMRNMSGCIAEWSGIYQQALDALRPGGWLEMLDFYDPNGSGTFYSHFRPDTEAYNLLKGLDEAQEIYGRKQGIGHLEEQVLIDHGFVDIKRTAYNMPISAVQENQLGKLWLLACMIGVEAHSLRLMTKYMGWSADRVRAACEQVCDEMKAIFMGLAGQETELRIKLLVVVARKPHVPGQWSAQTITENGPMVDYSGDESTIGS